MIASTKYEREEFKILESSVNNLWPRYCENGSNLSIETGNIYTGSLYLNLVSFLTQSTILNPKRLLMFSYGSGSMSSMFVLRVNPDINRFLILRENVQKIFDSRIKVEPKIYSQLMREREINYGEVDRTMKFIPEFIRPGTIIVSNIDVLGRRTYHRVTETGGRICYPNDKDIGASGAKGRMLTLSRHLTVPQKEIDSDNTYKSFEKFYRRTLEERMAIVIFFTNLN